MRNKSKIYILLLATILSIIYFVKINTIATSVKKQKYKIGVLMASDNRIRKIEGLEKGLRQYNFKDAEIETIIRNAKEDKSVLENLTKELIAENVDVIVTTGIQETIAAKSALGDRDIPVVFIGVGCSVELGLVKDNISPACNVTGIDSHYVQLSGKRMEYLKKLVPDLKKVLILYNPSITPFDPSSKFLIDAAESLQVDIIIKETNNGEEILTALEENKNNVDGAILMCSLYRNSTIDSIVDFIIENKLPVLGVDELQVERGMLAFYGITTYDEGIQASRMVANLLKGQSANKIPIETPENLELHVNTETARLLGIEINKSELLFVDKFIQGKR